jgi:hypothetical protein
MNRDSRVSYRPTYRSGAGYGGFGVYNVFNRDNYRDVQNDLDISRFGQFFNGPSRTFHGKFVLEF